MRIIVQLLLIWVLSVVISVPLVHFGIRPLINSYSNSEEIKCFLVESVPGGYFIPLGYTSYSETYLESSKVAYVCDDKMRFEHTFGKSPRGMVVNLPTDENRTRRLEDLEEAVRIFQSRESQFVQQMEQMNQYIQELENERVMESSQ